MILSIEGCTQVSSVALYGKEGLAAEYSLGLKVTQSQKLLPAIHRMLEDSSMILDDVQAIAVSIGPGSFTGVRISVCTAKGLAHAERKPVIPVSTLLGLAHRFPGVELPICTLLDARKGEVYAAMFQNRDGEVEADGPERVISPEMLCQEVEGQTLFVGEGAIKYKSLLKEHLSSKALFVHGPLNNLSAASIGEIGLKAHQAKQTMDPALLVPNYIRRSEAEIRWKDGS